jgi:DNA polymerase elongation subunit (family B)
MEQYYKSNYIYNKEIEEDIEFNIIEWDARDQYDDDEESEGAYTIRCFGVTKTGVSITCKIPDFRPFYYIKVPSNFNRVQVSRFLDYIENSWQFKKKIDNDGQSEWVNYYKLVRDKCILVSKKDLFGFRNGNKYKFIRLVFNSITAMNKSKYIFKKPITIPGIDFKPTKYKLYESNFDPFMRFCHIKDILMAGWIKLPAGKWFITDSEANTQLEVSISKNDIVSQRERQEIANFLQASWDIETYSFDGAFPDPNKKGGSGNIESMYPNVIYQIATTFKYNSEAKTLVKNLLTLKKCDKIETGEDGVPVVVEECKTERDLILRWADLISQMDPDILYTYNGDSFDCMYVYNRAKLYNIEDVVLSKISRLTNIPAIQKEETFSSSAYGDSEFLRFYIPGRLNYDLLIHYKRGMKKYPSYKLDYIAGEILKEGKHPVTVKEIFSFYREGKPEQIREIGKYCIQDTELLQRLVDKQLILITIIQLANVTYVPIGFLVTRGQTIKVYSQILRKARQMDFLVPHTNFNEDAYPIHIKCKSPHDLEFIPGQDHVYIEINCGKSQTASGLKDLIVSGRISEIIDDMEFVVLSDFELEPGKEYYNIKYKYQNRDYIISRMFASDDLADNSFTGATVLTAIPGTFSENIGVLDFASLYPTIMISRNLCYSTFVMDNKYLDLPAVTYENMKWDDKIEYRLKHTCEAIGKTGISKGQVCGKQAFFDVSEKIELDHLTLELEELQELLENLDDIEDKDEYRKMRTKVRTKEKELKLLENKVSENSRYFCRTHDPIKKTRPASEKFQKRDVSYDYNVVQPTLDADGNNVLDNNGNKVNQGVLPALLEELYSERKKVKKRMAQAERDGDKLLEDILNSTQLAIKVSLNSTYGYLGRGQGNLILKPLGAIVTSVGRSLIQQSKDYAEGLFLEYIKETNCLTQKIEPIDTSELSEKEKDILLKQFQVR